RVSTIGGTAAVFAACLALPFAGTAGNRMWVFADIALLGSGLGFSMLSLLLAVQHSVPRKELGVATSFNMFSRSIGGAVGVSVMGAVLAAGIGGSTHATPEALAGGIAGIDAALRARFVVALQHAFLTAAVAGAAGFLVAFRVPN